MAGLLQISTGDAELDRLMVRVAGKAIRVLSRKAKIGHPDAIGLLHAVLTQEIVRHGEGSSGAEYIEATAAWIRLSRKGGSDADLDSIGEERNRRFQKWAVEAQAEMERANQLLQQLTESGDE